MTGSRRVGIYLDAGSVLRNPDYVPVLRDQLGLNLVIMGYTGTLTPKLRARSPFDGQPASAAAVSALAARHLDGGLVDPDEVDDVRAHVGPNLAEVDDDELRRAIALLRGAGVDVWMCVGAWTHRNLMYCPSKGAVNDWLEALYIHVATQYEIEAVDMTHARFPAAGITRALFSCACDDCARAAAARGYDMESMKGALLQAGRLLGEVDADFLRAVWRDGAGFSDLVQGLGMRSGVMDWFRFRAELLGGNMRRFRDAVHAAAGSDFLFGGDNYPASMASFVGHDYTAWDRQCDFASPLLTHFVSFVCRGIVAWAKYLMRRNGGLSEADALQIIYRLLGYDRLHMPQRLADYDFGAPEKLVELLPFSELILLELRKARLLLAPSLPSYPIIGGGSWPRPVIDAIVAGAEAAGHDGIIWQGTRQLVDYELR